MRKALLIAAVLALVGCTSSMERHVEYVPVMPDKFPQVTAIGYAPIAQQRGNSDEERVLQAMRASRLEAYRELVEQVQGVHLHGDTRVEDMIVQNDSFRSEINGIVRGAEVVRSYAVGDYYATE